MTDGDGAISVDAISVDTVSVDTVSVDTVEVSPPSGEEDDEGAEIWRLRLYVAGESPKSLEAFANLRQMCETHLRNRYEIEVVDLLEYPRLARNDDIVAIPTLVRKLPAPLRRIIGDLSDIDRVFVGLQLEPRSP